MKSLDIFILVILSLVNAIAIPRPLPPFLLPTKPQPHPRKQQNARDFIISPSDAETVLNNLDQGNVLKDAHSLSTLEQNVLNGDKNNKREEKEENNIPGSRKFDGAAQRALKVVRPEEKIRDIWAKAGMRLKVAAADEKHGEGAGKKKGAGGVDRKAEMLMLETKALKLGTSDEENGVKSITDHFTRKAEVEKRVRGKEQVKIEKTERGVVEGSSVGKEEKRNGKSKHDIEAERALKEAFPGTHRRPEKRDMLNFLEENESTSKEVAAVAATKDLHFSADIPADEFVSNAIAKTIQSEGKHGMHGNHGQPGVLQHPLSAAKIDSSLDLGLVKDEKITKSSAGGVVEPAVPENKDDGVYEKVELIDPQEKNTDVGEEADEAQKPILAEEFGY